MTGPLIPDLETKIRSEIQNIEIEIKDLRELTKPIAPENAIGRLSRMDAINNRSINEAALREKQNRLLKLENALARCTDENFGICSKCKEPIPLGRLMYLPESRFCTKCAV